MNAHIVVVEDETAQLRAILRTLESVEQVRCTGCSNLSQARRVLENDPPDLLATDINLGGENGLELLADLDAQGRKVPVIIMTAYRTAYDDRIPRSDSVTILEKPLSISELRDVIIEKIEEGRKGEIPCPLEVTDYLQLASMGRSSARLEAHLVGGKIAILNIVDGNIWSASLGTIEGEEVIGELIGTATESIVMRPLEGTLPPRQIHIGCEQLLLKLATTEDEISRNSVDSESEENEKRFAEAFAEGIEASIEKNYEASAEAFRRALEFKPQDPQALYNLVRVTELMKD